MTYFDYDIYVYDVEGFALSFSNKQCVFPFMAQTRSNQVQYDIATAVVEDGFGPKSGVNGRSTSIRLQRS